MKKSPSIPSGHGIPPSPLHVAPAAKPIAPRLMAEARSADAATRERLVATYEACLSSYREIARRQGDATDTDDVDAAMAFFVAANLHALHGVDIDAGALRPLAHQLHGVTRAAANWDAATLTQRQIFFERIAIVSVLVSGSLASAASRGPAEMASLRRQAREYLQLLGLDPDHLTLGSDGLVLRRPDVGAATLHP